MKRHALPGTAVEALGKKERSITSQVQRFQELYGSEVIHANFRGHSFAAHTHDTWTIGWIEHGANHFRRHRKEWVANANTVCIVNPGEAHTGGGKAMTYWNLMPSEDLLSLLFPETSHNQLYLRDAVVTDTRVTTAIRRMFEVLAGANSPLLREQAVVEGLTCLFKSHQSLSASDIREDSLPFAARIAQEYIEAHLDSTILLADLARVSGLSLFHFCRVFESAIGMPPAAYVRNRRVHRAKQLIRAGSNLADAAINAGFADQAHLTRQFRAVMGVTPSQWRA